MPGYVIPIMVIALVAVGIGGVVFVIFRLRTGQGLSISWRSLFLVYFYLMTVISLLVMVGGLSNLVRVGMGAALGKEFSYHASRYAVKMPPPPVRVAPNGVPTAEESQEPTSEEQEAERQKALDRSLQEGLLNGLSFTIVGGIIWGAHLYGRRRLERGAEEGEWLHRLYVIALLLTFGILTLTSLPQAVFDTLRYYVIEEAPEFYGPPGDRLSTGIVALPLWLYYLWGTFRLVRNKSEGT